MAGIGDVVWACAVGVTPIVVMDHGHARHGAAVAPVERCGFGCECAWLDDSGPFYCGNCCAPTASTHRPPSIIPSPPVAPIDHPRISTVPTGAHGDLALHRPTGAHGDLALHRPTGAHGGAALHRRPSARTEALPYIIV